MDRYKRLNLWNKTGFWGSIASIIGIPLAIYLGTQNVSAGGTSSQSQPSNSAITTGDQSPAIGSNEGNVTINYNASAKEKNSVLRNPRSGVTLLLASPNLAVMNDPKHQVCLVHAGTPVTLTGRTADMGKIKDMWREVTITAGDCANKVGWVTSEHLSLE